MNHQKLLSFSVERDMYSAQQQNSGISNIAHRNHKQTVHRLVEYRPALYTSFFCREMLLAAGLRPERTRPRRFDLELSLSDPSSGGTGNYSAISNNMKLAQWPLMGGLLHLQRRGDGGPQPVQGSRPLAVPNVTAHPSAASVPIIIIAV